MSSSRLPLLLLLPLLGFFSLISLTSSSVSVSPSLVRSSLGIRPEDLKYFKSDFIKCKDGSKKFSKAQLNDDFCDCPDGTDEPGTSACPGGKFYCQNAGHTPRLLFSSRVNDGICDCCDGSDEYDGRLNCTNTCWEAGKVARDKLKKRISTFQEGVSIRKKEVQQAKEAIAKDEAELIKLKNEEKILKGLVQQLNERKEQIEKAEENERLEKEKEEKRKRDSEEKSDDGEKHSTEVQHDEEKHSTEADDENHESIGLLDEPSVDQDEAEVTDDTAAEAENEEAVRPSIEEINQMVAVVDEDSTAVDTELGHNAESKASTVEEMKKENHENTEDLSREELGRLVASRWTGENAEQTKEMDHGKEEQPEDNHEAHDDVHDEEGDGYNSEMGEDSHKYDDEEIEERDGEDEYAEEDHDDSSPSYTSDSEDQTDFSDVTTTSSSSWLDKIQQTVRNILQAVNFFQTPIDKSGMHFTEAAHVRKEYGESSAKLSKIQSRISSLDEKLKLDFGTEKEFYSFYGRCFENKQNKYVYKVCPFKKASQVEGHSTTQLGHWEKFEDSYRTMAFSNGDKCWNGPDRSIKVRLRCGLNNELTDVDEPSRCEYVALLSTPALCFEQKLKELQQKLDLMKSEQPQIHEEL
ncbi:hypothetical protein GIB67_006704 [Kingdonia uniflora]|uniref:Glucosidase 2 subunit beta n=1 Tax=Kingdonia uniflora TaxID=39325 RepID=A0A7J7LYJ7_9MAGN|nr:hypothetical protein GIB67_006704 [Kingdonia uniflora]